MLPKFDQNILRSSLKVIQSKMAQIIFQQIKQPETQFLNSFQQIFFV